MYGPVSQRSTILWMDADKRKDDFVETSLSVLDARLLCLPNLSLTNVRHGNEKRWYVTDAK